MDFAGMKRRELQALCKRHGLAGGGTNVDLVTRLTATLSGSGGAAEEAVGVVVGKGCLKRSAGGDSDAAKKVSFEVEEDEEAEVGISGRGSRRSQVTSSPAVAKTSGRRKAGEAPPAAKGNGGGRRRTRSQAGGDSADESDSGEAAADAPVRRSVTRKNSAKAEQEEVEVGGAAGRKHQLKRKTRENDIEDVDVSVQAGVSRRSTRSTSLLIEPDALSSPVEKKRGRRKASDAKEKTRVEEKPTEALPSGRTLRSGVVVVAPVPPNVSESKKSRREVQEEEPAVEKVAEVEIYRRTTRSSTVSAPLTSPKVTAKKRGRKTDDVHSDGGPDKETENKRQSSRLTSSIHHSASTEEEATLEQVAAPSKGLPPRRSRRNPSEANVMLNSNTTSESSRAPTHGNGPRITRGTMLSAAKDGVEDGVEKLDEHVGLKKSKLRKGSATVATSGGEIPFSDSTGKASATDMQIEVPGPVRRLTRKSVVPSSLEPETNGMHEDVEKKQTVTKPAGRSTRRSVAPVILEKESKGLTKEIVPEDVEKKQTVTKPVGRSTRRSVAPVILEKESKGLSKKIVPEAHVKRPTRNSVVPAILEKGRKSIIAEIIPEARVKRSTRKPTLPMVNSENNDHCDIVGSENLQSDKSEELEKQPTVKQPVRRLTRKSAVPAMPEKDRKGLPDMLNNDNGDRTEMQSDKAGQLEKQLAVKEHVRKSASKSVVPDVIEKENKGLHEELKSEVSARTPACKSVVPNAVNKNNKDHNEFVRTEELSVKTRSAHTRLQVALQNDESLQRTTRRSSKLAISPPQSKPTASKGRPAKRRRTSSLQEDMPEEQKEDQIAYGAHTNDVTEATTSTDLEIGVLPFAAENSDLRDSHLNSELEGMIVVEPGANTDDVIEVATSTDLEIVVLPFADEKSDLRDPQLNSELEGMVVVEPGAHTDDMIEVATSTDLETGMLPCAAEKSDLRDSQLNSELEGTVVVQPGLSRDKDDTDILESELEGTVGTTEKPSSNLLIPDSKHVGALSEEVVHSIENDAGRCSTNFEQSPTGLLFSQGIAERSATHNAIPCPENSVVESDVHKVECQVETAVSSKSDSYQGSDQNSVIVEESGGFTFSSQQNNKQEGFSVSSCPKDLVASAQLDPPEDADHVVRDVFTKDLICKEEEKKDYVPSSDINVAHEISPANEPGKTLWTENASGVSGAVFCISQTTPIFDEVNSDSSPSESADALDNRIASSNTEAVQQDNKDECNLHNGVTHGIHASGMSEAAQVEVSESGKMLLPDVETSAFRDAQLNRKREGNEFEEHSFSCSVDESGKNNTSQLANEYVMDSCQEKELKLSHDLSAVKSPKGSTTCQDEFVIASGIGQTSGSIVKGNNIATDAPGTAKQRDDLNPSATALLRNRENTPAYKIDAPEVSSDNLFVMDLSAQAVQSVSGRLREAGLSVDNPDNKLHMEQVQQDDVQVLEVHAKNGVDESKDIHVEYGVEKPPVPESVPDHDSRVDFGAVSRSEDCAYTSDEGLTKSCHEQEQMACQVDLLEAANCMKDFTNPEEVSYDEENKKPVHSTYISSSCEKIDADEPVKHAAGLGDGLLSSSLIASTDDTDVHQRSNPNQFESTDFLDEPKGCSSTEALQQGLKEQCDEPKENKVTLFSSSLIASTDDTNVHQSSNPNQFESTDFLDEPKGCSSTEALQQGPKEQCDEPKENQVTLFSSSLIESTDFLDEPKGYSSTEALQQGLKEQCDGPKENQVTLFSSSLIESTDFLDEPKGCSSTEALQQGLKEQCDKPKENQVTYGACPSDRIEAETAKDLESEVPPLPAEEASNVPEYSFLQESSKTFDMPDDLVLPITENEDDSNTCRVEKMVSSEADSSTESDMHGYLMLPSAEDKDDSIACPVEHDKDEQPMAPPLAAETLTFPDEQANPKLEAGEYEKCNFSSEDTSQLEYEKDEQLIAPLLAGETSALPDEQANPELDAGEFEKCNFSSEDTSLLAGETLALPDEQANPELDAGEFEKCNFSSEDTSQLEHENDEPLLAAETSALPDEQANLELEGGEFKECNLSNEDTSGICGTGYVKTNLFQLHEDSHMDPIQEKGLPNDLPARKSPEQSTICQDAKTLAMPDEQPNPELEGGEFEERNLASEDTGGIFGSGYVKTDLFQLHEDYPIQGRKLLDDLLAPKSPEQSRVGQDAGTLAWLDGQPNPELEVGEFEERNFSTEDTSGIFGTGYDEDNLFQLHEYSRTDLSQGKDVPNYVPATKSPKQSTIGQDENALESETAPLPDEKFYPELEGEEFKERNLSCDKAASYIFSSGSVKNNTCHWGDKEEYNEHNDDQATAAMVSSGMTKPTLIEGSESGRALLSAAGMPALTDEQLNSKMEDDEEQNLCFNTDTSNFSDTGLMENSNMFSLPEDAGTETCYEHELPIGTPAAKSTGESAVCPDDSVPGSVGTCQTSISTKLLRFKISSAVKGSYIAMGSAITKQGEKLRPISLLGNTENVPAANPDHPAELDTDWSDVKDSSKQGSNDEL
ncbi:hypothetical protein ACQ4PT_024941 [Festuca glaucescens]